MKDLRVIKTEKIIKETFIELLLKKDYKDIRITELCELALINRRTFYLHYNSLDDLLNKLLEDLAQEFINEIGDYNHFEEYERFIRDYFLFTYQHPLFEKLNNNTDYDYMRSMLNSKVGSIAIYNQSDLDTFHKKMMLSFYNGSIVNMYRTWSSDKSIPIEEAIETTIHFIKNGLKERESA